MIFVLVQLEYGEFEYLTSHRTHGPLLCQLNYAHYSKSLMILNMILTKAHSIFRS